MRTLPRLSESQAVGNFREILSEKGSTGGPSKVNHYRHVSHKDFRSSQETTMITSTNHDTKRLFAKSRIITNSTTNKPQHAATLDPDETKNNQSAMFETSNEPIDIKQRRSIDVS